MKYCIEIWKDEYHREEGHSYKRWVTNTTLKEVKLIVEHYYIDHFKDVGGSMEILDSKKQVLFHISEDSQHKLEKVLEISE